jgi:transcriptional regulator with XRE-family HTH domain
MEDSTTHRRPGPSGTLRLTRLRAVRERRLLTQADLARVAGLGHNTVSRLEAGGEAPRPSTVKKLARALRVPPEALMEPADAALADALKERQPPNQRADENPISATAADAA